MLDTIFKEFVEESPVSVMMRGLMERILSPDRIDQIFENHRQQQYTREVMFSSLVNLMTLVVCSIYPSVNAAYKAKAKELNVTRASVYNKLGGVELAVSQALVRETAADMAQIIEDLAGQLWRTPRGISDPNYRWKLFGCHRPSSESIERTLSQSITR